MKTKVIVVVLLVVCAGLAIAYFANKQDSEKRRKDDLNSIMDFSNQVVNLNLKNTEVNQVNLDLKGDVTAKQQQLEQLSNSLATASAALADSKAALANAQGKITDLSSQITDLEARNKALDQSAMDLTNVINQLNASIEESRNKLATSESNNTFLQNELQKQMAQRAEIEHKFNDIDELRLQLKKVKTDMFIARHAQLARYDNQKRGAELLMSPNVIVTNLPPGSADYGLNVEVGSDGSVRVIPPLGAPTNAPAH